MSDLSKSRMMSVHEVDSRGQISSKSHKP